MQTQYLPIDPVPLRDSKWAMALLGYAGRARCSFWGFVHANNVPHVRIGKKKIVFSERAVMDWLASRSSNGKAA